mgnify:CR=1 FL=1
MNWVSIINFSIIYILLIWIICLLVLIIGGVAVYGITSMCGKGYDGLKDVLRCVKNNDKDYMNFGYWETDKITLAEANTKLSDLTINQLKNKGGRTLDVGCVYGEQDIYWTKRYKMNITAIDISKKQINECKEKAKRDSLKGIKFMKASATNLPFQDKSYDNIVCLESAFHYKPRTDFFKESYRVLKEESEMVIADLTVKKNMYGIQPSVMIAFFKKLLSVPDENLITTVEYVKQLEKEGYSVEPQDITEQTFQPYFKHFFKNLKMPNMIFRAIFDSVGYMIIKNLKDFPFEYTIYKCKKGRDST